MGRSGGSGARHFEAQAPLTFENLRLVLEQADASFDAVVKVTVYGTDMSNLRDFARVRNEFHQHRAAPSLHNGRGRRTPLPGTMIEVEAITVV
jgi:enamine deaminase RidA (YjgF/YER057c/UK114 family)